MVHWGLSGQKPGLGNDPATPQETESCHLIHALLRFYVNTVFKSYRDKAVEFGILKSFSTLANNFFVIVSKLQASVSRTKLGRRSTGDAVLSEDSFPSPYLALAFIPCQGAAGVLEQGTGSGLGVHLQGGQSFFANN